MFQLQKQKALEPEELMPRRLSPQISKTVAVAQTFNIPVPTDHFIHSILIGVGEDTDTDIESHGTLADDLTDIQLVLNGNNYVKDMTAEMCKAVCIMNGHEMDTGYYQIFFTDPKIPQAKPIPAWLFSSIYLNITDNAPLASNYHHIHATMVMSERHDITGEWQVLIEKCLRHAHYGTNTGWMDYDHERAYNVLGYLYCMDDDGTLSDTVFNKLRVISQGVGGEKRPFDEEYIPHLQQLDKVEYKVALPTGFVSVEFPAGLPSNKYSSLMSQLNVKTAGTDASLRVLERYVL